MTVPESHKCQGEHLLFETCKERKRIKLLYFVSLFVFQRDCFKDDLFPLTKVLWEPSMTASRFGGAKIPPKRMDLKPNDIETRKSGGRVRFSLLSPSNQSAENPR